VKESREVKELRTKILGMEMELGLLSTSLERYKRELTYNKKIYSDTIKNLNFLKKSKAAVSIKEYKKILQQNKLAGDRIIVFTQKIQPLRQLLERKEDDHKEEMKRFERAYRQQFKTNILEFPYDRRKKA